MKHQALKGAKPNVKCLTRFICGISMPLFKKAKVCQLDDFAALTHAQRGKIAYRAG